MPDAATPPSTTASAPTPDLGQRKAYVPAARMVQWPMYGLIVVGWILATTIAAAITRALRRQWRMGRSVKEPIGSFTEHRVPH